MFKWKKLLITIKEIQKTPKGTSFVITIYMTGNFIIFSKYSVADAIDPYPYNITYIILLYLRYNHNNNSLEHMERKNSRPQHLSEDISIYKIKQAHSHKLEGI